MVEPLIEKPEKNLNSHNREILGHNTPTLEITFPDKGGPLVEINVPADGGILMVSPNGEERKIYFPPNLDPIYVIREMLSAPGLEGAVFKVKEPTTLSQKIAKQVASQIHMA